jgi:hypothetical protein
MIPVRKIGCAHPIFTGLMMLESRKTELIAQGHQEIVVIVVMRAKQLVGLLH